jgi:hypothetical protein
MSSKHTSLKSQTLHHRKLGLESLESRVLLSISPFLAPTANFGPVEAKCALVGAMQPGGGGSPSKQISGGGGGSTSSYNYGSTFSTAYPLTLSSSGTCSISGKISSTGQVQMFSLADGLTGTMTVTVTAPAGKTGVVPQLVVYDSSGTVLASSGGSSGNKTASASISVAAGGTYYFSVSGVNSSTGNFSLQLSVAVPPPPPPPAPTPPSFLPVSTAYSAGAAITAVVNTSQVLVVTGTSGSDVITISESGTSLTVTTPTGSQSFANSVVGIAVYGFGGGDTIRIDHTVAAGLASVVYETGTLANTLSDAGMDTAYLYAGSGNDTLITVGGGADVLYGGSGLDSFWCDTSDTIVGATTAETAARSIHQIAAFSQPTTTSNVTLQVDGQTLPQPVAAVAYSNSLVNKPLWVDGPQYNDIRQGVAADCYFLAGLSALADNDPGLLEQSIVALGDGSYAVRFYNGGTATYWRVDAQLPTSGGSPYYAKLSGSGELWVPLLEKAFTQFRSGQNSYSSINNGYNYEPFAAITGSSYGNLSMGTTADALAQSMASTLAAGHAVTAASLSTEPGGSPIVSYHVYNVHSVSYVNGAWQVTVYNPWGYDGANWDSNSSDGLLVLTSSQFQSWYSAVVYCNA